MGRPPRRAHVSPNPAAPNWQVLEERDGETDALEATYVYGNYIDEPILMDRAGEAYYYIQDDLMSVIALTSEAGTVVETIDYMDYGEPIIRDASGDLLAASAIGNPYLFTGRRLDAESGQYHYRTRQLDVYTGQFTAIDSIGIWGDAGNMGGGYGYVGVRPTTSIDPWGESKRRPSPGEWTYDPVLAGEDGKIYERDHITHKKTGQKIKRGEPLPKKLHPDLIRLLHRKGWKIPAKMAKGIICFGGIFLETSLFLLEPNTAWPMPAPMPEPRYPLSTPYPYDGGFGGFGFPARYIPGYEPIDIPTPTNDGWMLYDW